jgi:Ion channel
MERYLENTIERFAKFWWGEKGLTILLAMLMLAFIIEPLIDTESARISVGILLCFVLVAGVGNVSKNKIPRIFAGLLTLTAITLTWLQRYVPDGTLAIWVALSSLACLTLLTIVTLRHVFQAGPVTADRVRGAVAAYILLGLSWAFIYQCLDLALPGAFSLSTVRALPVDHERNQNLAYFSFVTLTTLGYGDIVPIHRSARMFAVVEALIGQLYPATLLARLISQQVSREQK